MRAFLTGSYAYGKPRSDSDIDLVVLCDHEVAEKLLEVSTDSGNLDNGQTKAGDGSATEVLSYSVRFGKLNLLLMIDDGLFDVWRKCTDFLAVASPVTREAAVALIKSKMDDYLKENELVLR